MIKSTSIVFAILFLTVNLLHAQCEKDLGESKKLGLISYLTHVKVNSEQKLLEVGASAQKNYGELRVHTDKLINQLCADMTDRKGLNLYRTINEEIKTSSFTEKSKAYQPLIDSIDYSFCTLSIKEKDLNKDKNGQTLPNNFSFVEGALGLLSLEPYGLYKDITAARAKKTELLVAQIKELKLQPLTETKDKEENAGQAITLPIPSIEELEKTVSKIKDSIK